MAWNARQCFTLSNEPANRQMTGTLLYNTRRDTGGQDAFVVKLTAPNYVVSLTSAANPVLSGQPVTVTAAVTAPGKPPIATGSMTMQDDRSFALTLPVANGTVSTTIPNLAVGIRNLSASYIDQGDGGVGQMWQLVNPAGPCQSNVAGTLPPPGQPLVVLTSPTPCSTTTLPATVTFAADAVDPDGRIALIDFMVSGNLVGSATSAPFTLTWNNPAPTPGTYTLTAMATDNSGLTTTSTPVVFTVGQPNQPPTVSLSAPANGASFRAGGTVTVTANAADADGSIARVDFLANGSIFASTNVAPYTGLWSNFSTGNNRLNARATDNQGAQTFSADVFVTVTPNNAPTVSLTAPVSGAQYVSPATIPLAATAADSDGSVSKVEFLLNGFVMGTAVSAPYTFTATNIAPGNITATARATDNDGTSTTSAGVTITVAANQAPTVSITAPASGASFSAPTDVTVTMSASDSDGSVAKVELFAGNTLLATLTTAPYTTVWRNPLPGSYVLAAKATDDRGATRTSTTVPITIGGTAVSITAPADNASFAAPATFDLAVTARTTSGTITKLDFFDGATLLGTINIGVADASAAFNLRGVAAGSHVYTVKATHSSGSVSISAPVNIIVTAPPTITLIAPGNNSFYIAPATISLSATASGTGSSLAKVEFFAGATLVATATAAPYQATWINVPAGSYTITAKATDARGGSATSPPVTVTVGTPSLTLASPADGATVSGTSVMVTGNVQGTTNSGVTVNNVVASIDANNNFYATVPLAPGTNTLTATLTLPIGQTATRSITVNSDGITPLVSIVASPTDGIAPLTVTFTVNNGGDKDVTLLVGGSAGPGVAAGTEAAFALTFNAPGTFPTTVNATDTAGNITTRNVVIVVRDPVQMDLMFKATWSGMNDALIAGDKTKAMSYLNDAAKVKYGPVFDVLMPRMAEIVASYTSVQKLDISNGIAEYTVNRTLDGVEYLFFIYFLEDGDGVWRIDSM